MNIRKYDIKANAPITRWDEALPLGNGKMGCLIYGDNPLLFSLDRQDLWDARPNPTTLEKGFCFANLKKLVQSGSKEDWAEYTRLFDDIFMEKAYPTKITAGRMELQFERDSVCSSALNIQTAIASVMGKNGKLAEVFLSATRFIGVARVWGRYALNLHIPTYISGEDTENNSGIGSKKAESSMHYPKAEIVFKDGFTYYEQTTFTDFRYGILVYTKHFDTYDELYFCIPQNTEYNGDKNFMQTAKAELIELSKIGYSRLQTEHISWWKNYWKQSKIQLNDSDIERVYYRSWYLFASTSRKGFYPMPLQGVWTADNDCPPPWKGDYHHDTNTQLSYQAYLKANRLKEGEAFIDYLWNLKEEYARFAKNFFGVDGLLIPSCSTIDGKPMGGWAQYSLSPTMSIWAAQSFDEQYLYTGDKTFLKTRAYPFFKEIGKAIYALMEEKDGKLYLPLSTSPEIFDNKPKAYLTPNSNFDLALITYLFKTLKGYAQTLNKGKEAEKYEGVLQKLDDIALLNGKVILLDKNTQLTCSHRHFSHLMCLYPLHLINYDTPEHKHLYECTLYEIERLGSGAWVGFSYAMSAQIYAMAQKGNAARNTLWQFTHGFVADNGFHLNGDFKEYGYSTFHYRPFTLESLFGYCDAVNEMLLQDHMGYIHAFAAIPELWKKGKISFTDLRSRGGVLVSAKACGGVTEQMRLKSKRGMQVRIKNTFGVGQVCVQTSKGSYTLHDTDGYFVLDITRGQTTLSAI